MLESLPTTKSKKLKDMMPSASNEAIDMMQNLLKFNPTKRLTVDEAL